LADEVAEHLLFAVAELLALMGESAMSRFSRLSSAYNSTPPARPWVAKGILLYFGI